MGYGTYDTPKGPAGYNVADTCHEDGCDTKIDRGMAYRCGDSLVGGIDDDDGNCGWWFCERHLQYVPGDDVSWQVCAADAERWNAAHPECGLCGERGINCLCAPGDAVRDADGRRVEPGEMPDPVSS